MKSFPRLPRSATGLDDLPPLDQAALLLDLDGTLLDIAARPEAVIVPAGLPETLLKLRSGLGQALAVVTGRPIEQVDFFLPAIPAAIAGEHGGAIRHGIGEAVERAALPSPPADWILRAEALAAGHPGVLLERKQRGFVLHYRAVPELGETLRQALAAVIADDPRFVMLAALMAWEIRPRGVDKGTAVVALMARPPFAGRLPVFIGDDTTDEDGMRAARAAGGAGLRVDAAFGGPGDVRAWLAATAESLG